MQLLSKITIGGQELKNRLVLAPLTRSRCNPTLDPLDENGSVPNQLMADYYTQRANAGLIITEATAISEQGSGWLYAPHIHTQRHVEGWKNVTDQVHAADSIIYLQLWHMGRMAHSSFHPKTGTILAPSAIAVPNDLVSTTTGEKVPYEVPVAMTIAEIQDAIQDYARAAVLAKQAGFDGIELHSANGYLIDTFLQSSTNKRTDQYGGSMENRVRFLDEVIQAIIDTGAFAVSRIGIRLSPNGTYTGMGSSKNHIMFPFVAKSICSKYKLAYVNLMDGLGFGFHGLGPAVTASDIKPHCNGVPLMCNVGLTKDMAEGMLRSGSTDLCCFGRLYMSNPDLAARFAHDWPLADLPPYETWYTPTGAKGYTDWPSHEETEKADSPALAP